MKFDQFAKKQVKKYFFYIWTSKKIVVQIKQLQKKIIDYLKFQKQKTPKNPCNSTNSRKTTSFTMSRRKYLSPKMVIDINL